MNTVKSFWIGWGSLCISGGAAYYFAKQSINADRQTRYEEEQKRRRMVESLEYSSNISSKTPSLAASNGASTVRRSGNQNGGPPQNNHSGSPSQEATSDPTPTRHAPESGGQRVMEKSKYEASEPYRAKKGDRLT